MINKIGFLAEFQVPKVPIAMKSLSILPTLCRIQIFQNTTKKNIESSSPPTKHSYALMQIIESPGKKSLKLEATSPIFYCNRLKLGNQKTRIGRVSDFENQ